MQCVYSSRSPTHLMGSIGAHRVLQGGEAVVAAGTAEFLRVAIGGVVSTKVNRDI